MIVLRLPNYNIDHRWGDDYLGVIRLPVSPPYFKSIFPAPVRIRGCNESNLRSHIEA